MHLYRPGGPSFYINVADNSRLHGPGGQGMSDVDEVLGNNGDADPSFGRLVSGFDVVHKIQNLPMHTDGKNKAYLLTYVTILDAYVKAGHVN